MTLTDLSELDRVHHDRLERLRRLGFGEVDADLLAGARHGGSGAFFVSVVYIGRMLERGATHDQIKAILL